MSLEVSLIDEGMTQSLAEGPKDQVITVTDPTTDRYNTFGFISWWRQDIVRNASVMVVGAGALGNEVLKNLALMGVGRILVVDFDTIDDSNLSRSVLFRAVDNGRKKAEAAAEAVRELNPDVAVQWVHGDINHDLGLGVYRRMDAVIGCLDNREARLAINRACWHLNKPWVDGAIQELLGIARVFWPNRGACYECTLTDEDYRIINVRMSCTGLARQNLVQGKAPTTPTISSIIAGIQTQEALKLLHGMSVETGKALVFNGLMNDVYTVEYQEREDCLSHDVYDEIVELSDARSDQMTLRELLAIARQNLGADAVLEIPSFVAKLRCEFCQTEWTPMRPRHQLTFEEAKCPKCNQLMTLVVHDHVKGDESFLEFTLRQVGIPPLDVVPARSPDWRMQFFEISGDASTFLSFELGNSDAISTFYDWRKEKAIRGRPDNG